MTDFPYKRNSGANNKHILSKREILFFSDVKTGFILTKWIPDIAFHKAHLRGLISPLSKREQKAPQEEKT